ncbi:DUF4317 domain-containing protein [Clostridium sp. SYSU_GA19001]|uniref:DUF4317 family protein n=1 Tax=Clostridium caldaquaticum TaxID=2940653 RepID=UPI00207743CD|nr:DUF4317 family protein [Clostridium caldaquaticum]MCM8710358.1 DUF4317 domain-containing protein [Clostridium caldaquaticum]
MNKKELNKMKKEFKLDSALLSIKEIYNAYIKKDNGNVIYTDLNYFQMLDAEAQELYLNNFKKIVGGTLNTKLFELQFKITDGYNESQLLLNDMLKSEDKESYIEYNNKFVGKVLENYTYDSDVVVTLIKGEYWRASNSKNKSEIHGEDDVVQALPFIMGTINKVEPFKKTLVFNYKEREFKPSSMLDTYINLKSPLDGFMFPSFENGCLDINKVLFYNSKLKDLNYKFIDKVLNCNMRLTAEEEKNCFTNIIKNVVGESVKPEVIESIYSKISEIQDFAEEDEEATISLSDMKNILKDIEVKDIEFIDNVFEDSCGKEYKFTVSNILPDFNSKSLKVWNDDISICMNPKNLSGIRQVKGSNGERCLVIELNDDVIVEGFKLTTEE